MLKGMVKRVVSVLLVLLVVSSIALSSSGSFVAKADVGSVLKTIYTYVIDDAGEAVTIETDPAESLLILGIAVACGMKFTGDNSMTSFINGFWTSAAKNDLVIGGVSNLISSTVNATLCTVAMNASLVLYLRSYVVSLMSNPTISVIGSWATVGIANAPSGRSTNNFNEVLYPNSIYEFSMIPSVATFGINMLDCSLTTSINGSNATLADYSFYGYPPNPVRLNGAQIVVTTTLSMITVTQGSYSNQYAMTLPATLPFVISSPVDTGDYTMAVNAAVTASGVYGDSSDVLSGAPSQDPSISAQGGIDLTIPANSVSAIPSSTVEGQTAATIGSAVGAQSGTIADTTEAGTTTGATDTTPDWAASGTDSIDWSPLENLDMYDKFPFSLPWDLTNIATSLVAVPVAPDYHFNIPMSGLHLPNFSFEVNFSNYEGPVLVIRWGLLLAFTGGLAFAAYKLIKH